MRLAAIINDIRDVLENVNHNSEPDQMAEALVQINGIVYGDVCGDAMGAAYASGAGPLPAQLRLKAEQVKAGCAGWMRCSDGSYERALDEAGYNLLLAAADALDARED